MSTTTFAQLYTVPEVAELLKRSYSSIRTDVREGRLKTMKFGRNIRVHPDDLAAYLDAAAEAAQATRD